MRQMNIDLPGIENLRVSQLCAIHPVSATDYLDAKFQAVLNFILSDANPIGKVSAYFYRVEYQSRGSPHWHCIFWVQDAPEIGKNSPEEILTFICNFVSCTIPNEKDSELFNIVTNFQNHRCNPYCLRKHKNESNKFYTSCRFGFPRPVTSYAKLNDLAASLASRQSGKFKNRLYDLPRNLKKKVLMITALRLHWHGNRIWIFNLSGKIQIIV